MGRIKNTEHFGERNTPSQIKEPYKIFILAFEGNLTENDYFTMINDYRDELGIDKLIKIEIIERIDTKSSPKWVLNLLEEFKETYHINENDNLWMIIDRDKQNNPKEIIKEVIDGCKENCFNIAITNPCFELWLLLHCINRIEDYDQEKLLLNPKQSMRARKRYIENELTRINGSYNKKRLVKEHFIDIYKIEKAIRIEKSIENNPLKIIDALGSNVGDLVNALIDKNV